MSDHASDDCAISHFAHLSARPMGHIRNVGALTMGRFGDTARAAKIKSRFQV